MAVAAPELHVRALAEKNVPEGGVARVGGPGQHDVHAVELTGEEHRVAVEGNEGIFQPGEGLEVLGLGQTDGGPVKVLAPHRVVGVLHLHQPGVVGVDGLGGIAVPVHKIDF